MTGFNRHTLLRSKRMAFKSKITAVFSGLILGLCVLPVMAAGGMSEEQMQQMMQQAEKMQQCFADIDPAVMKKLETRGQQMQAEVRALCESGKRDQAQSTAMRYGREFSGSKEMQAVMKCGAMAEQMVGQMSMMTPEQIDKRGHVCDNM